MAHDAMTRTRNIVAALTGAALVLVSSRAEAYRPFDGTDADVAEPNVFELELGPTQYYRQGHQSFLIAPDLVLNFGLGYNTELVIDLQQDIAFGPRSADVPHDSLRGDDVLLKHIFREGTLQEKTGVSIAAEGGVLIPEVSGMSGVGASLDVITSYQWSWGAIHWNEWGELTREKHIDLFTGVILEGPHDWVVRPVAELFYDKDFAADQTASVLVGAIWRAHDTFSLDVGLRGARVGDENAGEIRFGLTWAIPMGPHTEVNDVRAGIRRFHPSG